MDTAHRMAVNRGRRVGCYSGAMRLSVVIPALDEADAIAAAVASARVDGSGGGPVEVIVVDGGSRDATAERARRAGARVLSGARGRARQQQLGLRESAGDAVLFLHADTRLPPGWDGEVVAALGDPRVVGGCFRFAFDRHSPALRLVEWGARLRVALLGIPYGDQALFARREALEAIGGVPQAPIMEDLDLVRALRARGRLVCLGRPAVTSARRYVSGGALRTMLRHWAAAAGWWLGLDRGRLAAWYRG